jgi:hypothetical protein
MHVVVGRPSVAINMHSVAISMHSVRNPTTHLHARGSWDPLCCSQVAISGHQWPSVAITCMHVVVGILFAPVSTQSVAISNHLRARGSWDPLCSPLTMVWRG